MRMLYVFLGITIVFIVMSFIFYNDFCLGGAIISGIITVFILLFHIICMFASPMDIADLQEQRKVIEYQCSNIKYDNIIDNNRLEMYNQVKEYNSYIAQKHKANNNFWLDCMVANGYDDLELIELK